MIRTGQTIYIEVVIKGITVVEVFREISVEIALEEVVLGGRSDNRYDLLLLFFNKRSAIYMGNLNTS